MNLADIRKRHRLDEIKKTSTHMLDDIRARHNLGKVSTTRERVEEAKAKPRLYKNEAEYYAANARPYAEVKAELDAVTGRRNTYDNEKAIRDSGISGKVWQKRYGEKNTERIKELERMIEMENKRIDSLTKEAQYGRLKEYNALAGNEDFDAKSVYDKNTKATVANQLYRQVNNPDLPLTNEEYSDATREITRQMTADEVKIFNYIYNTQGDKAAQEYFDYLKTDAPDPLNSRRGKEIASNIGTDVGRAIYGGIAAVDNTTQGVKQLFTSEAVKPTVAQYASAQAAEDVDTKVGKFAYDLSATVGNMAPSILASTLVGVVNPLLGKAVGSTLMGAASAGNTYTDAINSGMTPRQAMKYGAMVGASEAALESVLGGISKLGANPIGKAAGKLVSGSKFAKAIGAADNAFIRAAAKLAGSMAGEIAEEELQLFLEPLFKTMATDEKYDAPEWEEIVYTALISAASAGLFEAPGNIAEAVQESRQKKVEKILKDAIAEHEKQSGQTDTEVQPNADFAKSQTDENRQQTANDTIAEENRAERAAEAFTGMVARYADSMDANGQNVFVELYDGSVEPDVYVSEMRRAYDAGRNGTELTADDTASVDQGKLDLAYKAGQADERTANAGFGFVYNESSRRLTGTKNQQMFRNFDRMGRDLKVKIQFADSVRGNTANGSYRNGVITVSVKAENPYLVVAKHEITHHLKQTAAKSYGAYEAYAVDTFAKSLGLSADALVQDRIAEAARSGDRLTAEQAREEIAADFTEAIFTDEKTLRDFVEVHAKSAEGRNMLQRLFDAIRRFIAKLKSGRMDYSVGSKQGLTVEQLEKAERLYREVLAESAQRETGVSGDGKAMYSVKKDMSDAERYQELKDRKIFAVESSEQPQHKEQLEAIDMLPPKAKSKVEKEIYSLAETLGILRKPMVTPEIEFEFQISKNKGLKKSLNNQLDYGGNYGDFARALINLDKIIPNALLIDAYTRDRYAETVRANERFEGGYVLLGAYQDANNIIPVKLTIKKEKGETGNLYVVVAMTKIKRTSVLGSEGTALIKTEQPLPVTGSTYSLHQIISQINTQDADFLKYLPDGFLNEDQKKAKQTAIEKQIKKVSSYLGRIKRNTDYLDAVKRGDMETAQKMVDEAAKAAGYSVKAYHGTPIKGITVFDKAKIGNTTDDGIFGHGFYFTTNKLTADGYATQSGATMPTFLKIEKPWWGIGHTINQVAEQLDLSESMLTTRKIDGVKASVVAPLVNYSRIFTSHLADNGYDSVIVQHGKRDYEIVVFDNTKIKSADPVTYDDNGNVIPLSERFNPKQSDIRYSTKGGGLDALIKQYGEIEPGENPVREAHVPTRTEEKKWVSQTIRTVVEAGATPDVVLPNIEQIIAAGDVSREAYGDDAAIDKAKNKLKYDGWDKTISAWYNAVKKGEVSKDLTTMGWVLYNNAVNEAKNEKDAEKRKAKIKSSLDIIMAMVGHQRNAAQALQATRILKKLSPEAQLYGIMQSVRSLQDELEKKFKDKAPDLKIDYVLAERLLTATSDKARDDAMHDIYRDIGRQMPSTFLDKWNAWRYLAMLGNVRTHGRNIAGNAAFMPLVGMKNAVATGLEKAVYTFGGQRLHRTKGIPSKELLQAAYRDYSKLTDKERAGEKYNDNANANEWIEEGRQIFKPKLLEGARKLNSELLTREDEWFIKPHYALALAQYCKANGITAQMIAEGKGLDGARQYAIKEAQKATYRDANAVSEAVSKLGKYKGDNVALKAGSLFVDAVLPFRKTPANILVRAVEYSPIGLIKSVSIDLWRMKKGKIKISGAEVIDNFAAGLTGTALMGLGVLLSKLGLVIGMGSDDEDERKFSELQGYQGYAIVFDDRTYTVDWLAPEALPFFVGVNLAELKAFEELSVPEMVTALTNITAPMLEMSCLQGLNDMIEAAGSVQGKGVSAMMQMVSNAATSYLTQALPTLFGQAERITETTRQQTYTYKDSKLLTPNMQYTLGKAFNKLPGDIAQIPYIDAWGRETSTGNVGARSFNNLLNPGYSAKIRTSDMEKELQRLYDETGEKSVLPDRAQKYISVGGEKIYLTKNQYVKYATVKGQTSYDLLTRITASAQYKKLDEADKVKIIEKVYTYANAYAKAEVTKTRSIKAERYVPDGWIAEAISTTKRTGIPVWKYILIYNGQTGITGLKDKDGETIPLSSSLKKMEYVYSFIGLSTEQRNAIFADFGVAESVQHYSKARVLQKLEEMEKKAAK